MAYLQGTEAVAIQGIARDITARKIEEIALKESNQFMVDFVEYLPDAVMAIDLEGKVTVWNHAMQDLTGVPAEKMLGRGNYEYAVPLYGKKRPILIDLVLRPENIERDYAEIKQEHYVLTDVVDVPALKGGRRKLWARAVPLYDREGNLIGAIEALRDMTEHERLWRPKPGHDCSRNRWVQQLVQERDDGLLSNHIHVAGR